MNQTQRIFLQALVLSFLAHVIFFSMFIIQDMDFMPRPLPASLTLLTPEYYPQGAFKAHTTSNPELKDPKLVTLAEMRRKTAAPKLEMNRNAMLYEEELAPPSYGENDLSWLRWSLSREKVDYGSLFNAPPRGMMPSEVWRNELRSLEEAIRTAMPKQEISSSFPERTILHSPFPELPVTAPSGFPPVKYRILITSSGAVRYVIPEGTAVEKGFAVSAVPAIKQWRFSPAMEPAETGDVESTEWGWIIVPWTEPKKSVLPDNDNGGITP